MKKCIIIGAGELFGAPEKIASANNDVLVIAADGGYRKLYQWLQNYVIQQLELIK